MLLFGIDEAFKVVMRAFLTTRLSEPKCNARHVPSEQNEPLLSSEIDLCTNKITAEGAH